MRGPLEVPVCIPATPYDGAYPRRIMASFVLACGGLTRPDWLRLQLRDPLT